MILKNPEAEIFVPDNLPTGAALARTTHMAISAHQDDVEIMAYDGILKCFGRKDQWFCAVTASKGERSPRSGFYAAHDDDEMRGVRRLEQRKAAFVGEYAAAIMLDYSSSAIKDPSCGDVIHDLKEVIAAAKPNIIYTHNLADRHDTHIGIAIKVIRALRELPPEIRPQKLFGCEVWRDLDWMTEEDKVIFDVSAHPNLAAAIVEVFDSQVCGGKRYDLATIGRRMGNATFSESHGVDNSTMLICGMDMTPLVEDTDMDIREFILSHIKRFSEDVSQRLDKMMPVNMDGQ